MLTRVEAVAPKEHMTTEAITNTCVDCGAEIGPGSTRCKKDHGAYLARVALHDTATSDRDLLTMVDAERLNGPRLAARLGISKVRGTQKIKAAREREARRQELGIAV